MCSSHWLQAFTQGDPNMPLGPAGDCLEFQFDNVTHTPAEYFPITYQFPPDNGNLTAPGTTPNSLVFMSYNIQR
jgi:hypothetical protein